MLWFRQLRLDDVPDLMDVQETVRMQLPDAHLFQCEDANYYAGAIGGSGAGFGAFDGAAMAGYGIVTLPGDHPHNLCRDLPHMAIRPDQVAHLDGSAVAPRYRGQGIQRRLTELRISYAATSNVRHLLMTVSPMNPHSLRNHVNAGAFRVRAICQKYGGLWRLILHRELTPSGPAPPESKDSCALDDIAAHQRLLAAGLSGIRVAPIGGIWRLEYA